MYSKKGYLINKKTNLIAGNKITMKGVESKVLGIDDRGYATIMYPGYDYIFPNGIEVLEIKLNK